MASRQRAVGDARELAVRCLVEVERGQLLVPESMSRLTFRGSDRDRDFAHEIVYGVFRWEPGLTRTLARFCKLKKTPAPIRWLLMASLYQLRFMRVQSFAAVDEANKLAEKLGFPRLKGLVNGVLRNVVRTASQPWTEEEARAGVVPDWLAELIRARYGADRLAAWADVWRARGETAYWTLDDAGLDGDERSPTLPHAFLREGTLAPAAMDRGRAYVQNCASQAIAEMACRARPSSVLDLCAAPGGKSCYIAHFGRPAQLTAADSSPERMFLLKQNQTRLGLSFETRVAAAAALDLPPDSYDLVLADAPCSGLGIIGRHPEIKHLRKGPADETTRATQAAILEAGWRFVKPGGHLLYSVCSIDPAERPEPPADAVPDAEALASWVPPGVPCIVDGGYFRFEPDRRFDGFLGMALRKKQQARGIVD